jgi:recombination DNA repair RAD52 pathway protein
VSVQNCAPDGDMENGKLLERKKPKLDERFITTIEGKDFVMYPGLLDLGHQKGILKIEVDPMQLPTKENGHFAVCKALVVSSNGETFTDVGDASPENCSSRVSKHVLRMASTRAIARALRSFTNIGMTCLEELGDLTDVIGAEKSQPVRREQKVIRRKGNGKDAKPPEKVTQPANPATDKPKDNQGKDPGKTQKPQTGPKKKEGSQPGTSKAQESQPQAESKEPEQAQVPKMSEAQKRAIYNLSRRRGISVDDLEKRVRDTYDVPLEDLPSKQASEFIRTLQQAA